MQEARRATLVSGLGIRSIASKSSAQSDAAIGDYNYRDASRLTAGGSFLHPDVRGSFQTVCCWKTQAVFVPLDFRLRSFDVGATVHIGRREKTNRFFGEVKDHLNRLAGGADPVDNPPLRKWPCGPGFVFSESRQMAVGA